ncbi:glutamate synthase (NADPH), homotetrameric [Desulfuribacillus stibiiarsenatis]|uniref:Glutamate synthase (NADPH), homotetrameric n=1 Tax=Desulfuribacillus stibiiarsenatis TaxID=1390249 RepID=A0A1E5L6A4_9FIRM|nr:NADPH-dependent glutamate synthase [Desulfuribacillus stibiiarsenatis]OEH85665.1 glutamate synthase (NADPH), homotetrameric [Desulfuribacillus stibiiarsenatis]
MSLNNQSKLGGRQPMSLLEDQLRISGFGEVALGYTEEQAIAEAKRCLQCKKPLCQQGCPVNIDIKDFIGLIAEGKFSEACEKIKEKNSLPAVCGRVCPQEEQCEIKCIVGIKGEAVAIGRLERFVADHVMSMEREKVDCAIQAGKKVAVVGSGPAGLACASELAKLCYDVTMYEAFHEPGGVLMYGIPQFRLPKEIVKEEVEFLRQIGVKIECNVIIGKTLTIDDLFAMGFEAVFLGTGAGLPYFLGIEGENLNGVYSANEFLTRVNLMRAYKFPEYRTPVHVGNRVAVVGAGNVAMDAARTAKRLGAEVHIIYRRSEEEMPARKEEIEHAKEEEIQFQTLSNPLRLIGDDKGYVTGIVCEKMELGEPDSSGRRRPQPIPNSEFTIDIDTLVVAVGQGPNPIVTQATPELQVNKWGNIIVDEQTGATSIPGVYAGGDVVTGAATVIKAMGAGKIAAVGIHDYLIAKE